MKGCPTCSQLYAGEQIRFCRWDGATLQPVVVTLDEETTKDLLRHYNNQQRSAYSSGRLATEATRKV
jgi:hypothetical protein